MDTNKSAKQENQVTEINAEYIEGTSAILGEGSVWDYKKDMLYWIDIHGKKFFSFDPEEMRHTAYSLPKEVGTIIPESENSVVVALEDGIYRRHLDNDSLKFISRPESLKKEERFNDGKCDPAGRLWVGTMRTSGKRGDSNLYRMDHDGNFTVMVDSVSISNGIIWTADTKKMYYTDTPTRKIMEYDFDLRSGEISNPRIAVEIGDLKGGPDGITIDSEGMLWVALYGGASVCRFNPENGVLLEIVKVPAMNVTSCAFGGKDLDVLYITTARGQEENPAYPNAGGLFKAKPGVKGIKANFIKLD